MGWPLGWGPPGDVAEHLCAMGSQISTLPGKPHSFASSKAGGRVLRKQQAISGRGTLTHWRDLGAHANVSKKPSGLTLTMRLQGAAQLGPSIRALPGDPDVRIRMVHCKMLTMGKWTRSCKWPTTVYRP